MILFRQWSLYALLLSFRFCRGLDISTMTAVTTTTSTKCPTYYFYDHGTDKCEFCHDICDHAKLWNTVQKCEGLCPEYAQKLRDEVARQHEAHDDPLEVDVPKKTEPSNANSSQVAEIAGVVASALLVLLLLSLIIAKRKAIVGWFRRRRARDPEAGNGDPEAVVPLQSPQRQPGSFGDQQEDANVSDAVEAAREELISGTAVQESGKPSEGDNSWRILPPTHSASYDAPMAGGERYKVSIQETRQGQQGPKEMAISTSGVTRSDSTYLKTFLPSPMALPESRL